MKLVLASALACFWLLVVACTSGDVAPSASGPCTKNAGIWTCGGYGELAQCPSSVSADCTYDGGACFVCSQGAGEACGCVKADAGRLAWSCTALGVSCQP